MQLIPFLKSIADAIRGKEGSTAAIPAADFASRIANLPSGEDEIDGLVERTLTEFVNDRVTKIGDGCFMNSSLREIVCSNVKTVEDSAFQRCNQLSYTYLPNVTEINWGAFSSCRNIVSLRFPRLSDINGQTFQGCQKLETFDMYGAKYPDYPRGRIETSAFQGCLRLVSLIIRSEEYDIDLAVGGVTLSTDAFNGTPIAEGTGYIYIPRSLVDYYKTDIGWSTYANQIRALEDYTIDGTTTGELDPSKI